eukprot:GILK01004684.1.p1 GENE.GILK01004684.1~~GILK01004684.1.p1  ORF type:complete len:346 (-),score=44.15 GILK01004684.1:169-1095(-)
MEQQTIPVEDIVITIPHADEFDDDEELSYGQHMIAGATAGVMEHICMFPVDTIKTRLQVYSPTAPRYTGVISAAASIYKQEGLFRLYRGMGAIVLAAIPSHALYFATYEATKLHFGGKEPGHHPLVSAIAGSAATMAHDAVVTPLDVIKQRLQMHSSKYRGVLHTAQQIVKEEGARVFFASYPTTVIMNVPFFAVHFATYDTLNRVLAREGEKPGTLVHWVSGATAGALGAALSNPLDVVKTRIQTQGVYGKEYSGFRQAVSGIIKAEGYGAFLKGIRARMLFHAPSAAICWTSYETVKKILRGDIHF